jgi:L-amino acid N-acyltransferase YncA
MSEPAETEPAADAFIIRPATDADRDVVWKIFQATIAPGDAFVYDPNTPREEAMAYWFAKGTRTYVAEREGRVMGSYILRPNRPGLGDHVSNAGFMVAPEARGLGIGRAMGEHALNEARHLGVSRHAIQLRDLDQRIGGAPLETAWFQDRGDSARRLSPRSKRIG